MTETNKKKKERKWKIKKLKSSRCPIYIDICGFFWLCCYKLMLLASVSGYSCCLYLLVKRCFTSQKHIMVWTRDKPIPSFPPPSSSPPDFSYSLSLQFKVLQVNTGSQAWSREYYYFIIFNFAHSNTKKKEEKKKKNSMHSM